MTKEELKAALCAAIEKRLEDIRAIGLSIAEEPELGYKEVKTSAKVQEAFDRLGIAYETGFGVTGVKARLAGAGHRRPPDGVDWGRFLSRCETPARSGPGGASHSLISTSVPARRQDVFF